MIFSMCNFIMKQLKISSSIILLIFNRVNRIFNAPMMHYFFRTKISTNHFLHYKTMLIDITSFITKGVIRIKDANISIFIWRAAILPLEMIRTFILSFFKRSFIGWISFGKLVAYIYLMSFLESLIFMVPINSHWHPIISKIKAAFRFLTDTRLSVSTLLTADFGHRNSVNPLDVYRLTYY